MSFLGSKVSPFAYTRVRSLIIFKYKPLMKVFRFIIEQGNLIIPSGQAGVGIRDCPFDYILINGYRLCGERLNDATSGVLFVEDAPVTGINKT